MWIDRKSAGWVSGGCIIVAAVVLYSVLAAAPAGPQVFERPDLRSRGDVLGSPLDQDPVFAARRRRALNEARQKTLVADTDKLLYLARELDAEIQSGNAERLSVEQNAKVIQIEKLARQVKEKMVESNVDTAPVNLPIAPLEH